MRAVRFHAYGPSTQLRVDEVPAPTPGAGEVLIRVRAAAVNHWDIDMRNGTSRLPLKLPHTPGIEVAGDVAAVGLDVTGVAIGARVLPRYLWPCGHCQWCTAGEENHCPQVRVLGATEPGGYSEYVVVPASSLIPLPDGVPYTSAAALQGTYAPVWHALKSRLDLQPDTHILINAAGSGAGSAPIQLPPLPGARGGAPAGAPHQPHQAPGRRGPE